jgi:hypothetical protein
VPGSPPPSIIAGSIADGSRAIEYIASGDGRVHVAGREYRMKSSRWIALAAVLVAGSLAVSACGGSSKKTDNTPTAAAEGSAASTPSSGKTVASGTTPDATSSAGGSSSGGDPAVKAMGEKFAQSTFNATYKLTGSGSDQLSGGTLAMIKDGDTKFRLDLTTTQDGKETAIIFIEAGDVSAFCLKDAAEFGALFGIEAGQGVCFKTSATDPNNPVGSLRDSLKDFENADVTVLDKSSKSVAGQDGQCFKTKDNTTSEISTTCFNKDGAILYVNTEGDNASVIEAQTVSKSVSADDFKLPYEERELPASLGGDTGSTPTP